MKYLNKEIEHELINRGAKLVRFVDVSHLTERQNRQFPNAIVFALPLTTHYVKEVMDTPDYVKARIDDNFNFDDDEYSLTEQKAGDLSDQIAELLIQKGCRAFSQSDASLIAEGKFDVTLQQSLLPNKTIALLGGLGWIGKNNLLITCAYGAAQCLGTVLTDAPLKTVLYEPLSPKCGNCRICADICEKHVLKNEKWTPMTSRDEIVDIYGCSTCLKCMVHCSVTQTYIKRKLNK